MKIHDPRFVNSNYVSLVEAAIGEVGPTYEVTVNYIVTEPFAEREIDTWKLLVEAERKGMNRPAAIQQLTDRIAAMTPFIENPIVRAAVWTRFELHTLYIDQSTGQTIHRSSIKSAAPKFGDEANRHQDGTNNTVNPSGGSGGF